MGAAAGNDARVGRKYSAQVTTQRGSLKTFHRPVQKWFTESFGEPTRAQTDGWPPIARGENTLLLAPTGSGKTLAAFLANLDRLFFEASGFDSEPLQLIYVSPLKALGVDIERNLSVPIAGIRAISERLGVPHRVPTVSVRSGDTPQRERARFLRSPSNILITTPESLYLLLTSRVATKLKAVRTIIIDEIHALAGTKRGAHLSLSIERLEALRATEAPPLQRIGLSATARPIDEMARFLGGGTLATGSWVARPVTVRDAGTRRAMKLSIEVPLDSILGAARTEQQASLGEKRSAFSAILPRLVEVIRAHHSTMVFVNSRRLAERLASEINERTGQQLALAHHGSVAKERRAEIEGLLKAGELPAIVATSSLELGIDMGAVDLVVQVEAPPSVIAGVQRIGRAGHGVSRVSRGIVFPKFRGDLLACAAVSLRMVDGSVEQTRYPRIPLDVLAQQIVAMVAVTPWSTTRLFDTVRQSAPFADLGRASFDSVLDLLSGRYPSVDFAALRPRITYDRDAGVVQARSHARSLAIVNGGTIPNRGLFGVFVVSSHGQAGVRVGELDEEMVFESDIGDVFSLGASSWRIEELTHDRVLVSPAPGEAAKLPFWHGDGPGRAAEFGEAVGRLARELVALAPAEATALLQLRHALTEHAATTLVGYLSEQVKATGEVPSDTTLVVERYVDEVGDFRLCLLSPFGSRVHTPWAIAITARARARGLAVEHVVSDDGIVWRFPESDERPDIHQIFIEAENLEEELVDALGGTALFAARFRENAARALLLPRRSPHRRQPLWAQRKRSADLLAVASRFPTFPVLLETYRECLMDVFEMTALKTLLRKVATGSIRVVALDVARPSPFALSVMFGYVGTFLYDGDAPLAERRVRSLAIDHEQLRSLLGETEARALLSPQAICSVEASLQGRTLVLRDADDVHDLLIRLGHQTLQEIAERCSVASQGMHWCHYLERRGRALRWCVNGNDALVAVEDAARYRDALGVWLPPGLPASVLRHADNALCELLARYSRNHGPFDLQRICSCFGLAPAVAMTGLQRLVESGGLTAGAFVSGGQSQEWCDREVLRRIKRASLAELREQIEPVDGAAFCRFQIEWQHLSPRLNRLSAVVEIVRQLEGAPIVVSCLDGEIFGARCEGYSPALLDLACAQGQLIWRGLERQGGRDGRIALYTPERYELLAPQTGHAQGAIAADVRETLTRRGASFFHELGRSVGRSLEEIEDALWELVWAGEVTNDTLAPLRSRLTARISSRQGAGPRRRSAVRLGMEGRWYLLPSVGPVLSERRDVLPPPGADAKPSREASETERRVAVAMALLARYGVLTREALSAEGVVGGFSSIYPVLRHLESLGRVRRGLFVAGLVATQFALPGAEEGLRRHRSSANQGFEDWRVLATTDPANVYGSVVPWPETRYRLSRSSGTFVILHQGALRGYLSARQGTLVTFFGGAPTDEGARGVAAALAALVDQRRIRALLMKFVDEVRMRASIWDVPLRASGFVGTHDGLLKTVAPSQGRG